MSGDTARLQGTGKIAGRDGTYRFRIQIQDSTNHVLLRVWPASVDPAATAPTYQASGDLAGGKITFRSKP